MPGRQESNFPVRCTTSRGDRREAIFEYDDYRLLFLAVPKEVVERFN